ncbi:hypothetical protein C1645_811429 [Glomus cerebriforme]|uniref:F-box domain-containing protein n=1 Tax=Glomus cerebriforme TaxID=658196 RepID=A0A397TSG6_9GLOM|nr:hypothetical protein C1645_811429 [Glomus cerebriforme]
MSKLHKDVLSLIFEELQDDKKSLYSCLLVNRFWCETAVSILWKDPWTFLMKRGLMKFYKAKLFFNTILLHLSEDSRKFLQNKGIKLPQQQEPLLFNYITFCKFIKHRYSYNENIYEEIFGDYLIEEIYKLFISKCTSLKFLDVTRINYPIYNYPGAENSLSYLNELHCKSDDDPTLFYGLSQYCKHIKKFYIEHKFPNPGLAKLIEIQRNVKYISININDDEYDTDDNDKLINLQNKYQFIGQSIIKHAYNIIYLSIIIDKDIVFFNNLLPKLINLKSLSLDGYLFNKFDEQLNFSSSYYPKLQVLKLNSIYYSTAIKIIKKTDENCQIIWIENMKIDSKDDFRQFIQIIFQYCPNLKYVKIVLMEQDLENFKKLLINCEYLEGIYIEIGGQYSITWPNYRLFDILIKYSPITLYKIQFHYHKLDMVYLEFFFGKWKGRKSLHLYLCETYKRSNLFSYHINKRLIELIEKYKNENVIKNYEINKEFRFIEDYEEFNKLTFR